MAAEPPPELKPAARPAFEAMVQATQDLVVGEAVRYAWPVKKGLGSNPWVMALWFTQVLLVFQSFRVVAVTDEAVHVFRAGWFRRKVPRELLRTLSPGEFELQAAGRLVLGPERVRVEPRWRPVALAAYDVMRAAAQP